MTDPRASRLVLPCMTGLLTAGCMWLYAHIAHHNAVDHHGIELALLTQLVTWLAPWAIAVPLALLGLGYWYAKRKREAELHLVLDSMWVFAILWPVLVLTAWKVSCYLL